jgi:hypothetical protein
MSASDVRERIKELQRAMNSAFARRGVTVSSMVIREVNSLLEAYGDFLGKAKARHRGHLEDLKELDDQVEAYFVSFAENSDSGFCHSVVALGVRKISEILSFVEKLDAVPEEGVPKGLYEKLLEENEANKKVIEILSRVKGIPELNELLEKARKVGIEIDESWALALCSVNLIEAGVNQKLEELKESTEGNFAKRYKRLILAIKTKENRDIQQLLPMALYDGIRNKLDHASHANRVAPKEANEIKKIVINILDDLF